jgi:hypothetical protein
MGVKLPGREADHSSPSRAEVECVELYLHSPVRLHGVVEIIFETKTYYLELSSGN